jgi:soluble lytic murein transglycosylase-like protein
MIAAIIKQNRGMRFCFNTGSFVLLAVAASLPWPVNASEARHVGSQNRVRSVVRADSKTGRLVRSVVVTPKVIAPKPVSDDAASSVTIQKAVVNDTPVSELVETLAKKYEVDPLLVHSVIQVESSYDPYAVSSKGAQGIMQLMPGTARRFGVRNPFDTKDNLEGGVRYLKYLDSLFPNDIRLKLAAYNAGEGAVWKYNNKIPPYRETEQYVYKVGTRYGKALREARQKRSPQIAQNPIVTENTYAPVESFIDSDGRLHLRTAVRTP